MPDGDTAYSPTPLQEIVTNGGVSAGRDREITHSSKQASSELVETHKYLNKRSRVLQVQASLLLD